MCIQNFLIVSLICEKKEKRRIINGTGEAYHSKPGFQNEKIIFSVDHVFHLQNKSSSLENRHRKIRFFNSDNWNAGMPIVFSL